MMRKQAPAKKKPVIAVIGGSHCTAEEAIVAETIGREIAKRGAILLCGGLGGIMEAACRGAHSADGTTIGILPGENIETANPYVKIAIATGLGEARNLAIVKSAQVIIAIAGEYGTLSEIAFALKNNKPVIGLNTWTLSRSGRKIKSVIQAKDALDAVDRAFLYTQNAKQKG